MPGVLTHSMVGLTVTGTVFAIGGRDWRIFGIKWWRFLLLGGICAAIPDIDIIPQALLTLYYQARGLEGFRGVHAAYVHPLGHRGFTHSILFAVLMGLTVAWFEFKHLKRFSGRWWMVLMLFTALTASEGVLDAMNRGGGEGVGFFIPFENSRYWMPWRPLHVSPGNAWKYFQGGKEAVLSGRFELSGRGREVLSDEGLLLWGPMMTLLIGSALTRMVVRWRRTTSGLLSAGPEG